MKLYTVTLIPTDRVRLGTEVKLVTNDSSAAEKYAEELAAELADGEKFGSYKPYAMKAGFNVFGTLAEAADNKPRYIVKLGLAQDIDISITN